LQILNRIHIEIRECAPAHLRIADVRSIHREHRFDTTLSIDRKLLRKVRSPISRPSWCLPPAEAAC
jgi:hypothetical protein